MFKARRVELVSALAIVGLSSACNLATAGGTLGQLQMVTNTCPKHLQVAAYAADDVSANSRSPELEAERLTEIKSLATLTASCGGYLQVVAFSVSDAGTQTLFSGALAPSGATLNARLMKVPPLVANVMSAVRRALPEATAALPPNATDVMSEFTLMSQYVGQLGPSYKLYADLLTSGLATTGAAVTNVSDFTQSAALDLAGQVPMPSLSGSSITIAGVGRVASGFPAPSNYVAALTSFYAAVCRRSGAGSCAVITNPSLKGS